MDDENACDKRPDDTVTGQIVHEESPCDDSGTVQTSHQPVSLVNDAPSGGKKANSAKSGTCSKSALDAQVHDIAKGGEISRGTRRIHPSEPDFGSRTGKLTVQKPATILQSPTKIPGPPRADTAKKVSSDKSSASSRCDIPGPPRALTPQIARPAALAGVRLKISSHNSSDSIWWVVPTHLENLDQGDSNMTRILRASISAETIPELGPSQQHGQSVAMNPPRAFVPNKIMDCHDVIEHHTKAGDYERQTRVYGPNYAEVLRGKGKKAMEKVTEVSIPGVKVKVANKPKAKVTKESNKSTKVMGTEALQYPEAANRVQYPVPELGSESMPIMKPGTFPRAELLSTQVAKSLPREMQNIPPPVYNFSQKKNIPAQNPALTGAKPAPPRDDVLLPNPLDPTTGLVIKVGRDEQGGGEGRDASEFGDDDLPPAQSKIFEETAAKASRWAWFTKKVLSAHGQDIHDLENRVVHQQLSAQHDKRVNADAWRFDDHGDLLWEESGISPKARIANIDSWMIHQYANTVAQPYSWDMTTPGFISGALPSSGLAYDYQEFPGDMAQDPVKIHYGPIDWDAIPEPKLTQQEYLEKHRNKTSYAAEKRKTAMQLAIEKDVIGAEKIHAEICAQRKAVKERKTRAIAKADTSKAQVHGNPFSVQGKIHIRPVRDHDDLIVMTRIYNYYVAKTIDTPELQKISVRQMQSILDRTAHESYPCLVAVLRVDPGDPPLAEGLAGLHRSNGVHESTECIVGFSFCKSWAGIGMVAFNDVACIQVFVSPQYTGRKIATNLVDRTIGCLDRDYQVKQGAEIRVPADGPTWNRGWRNPQTLVMRWFFKRISDDDVQNRKKFLETHFGFTETGQLVNALSKDGNKTRYSMIQFQREANRFYKPSEDAAFGDLWM